MSAARLAVFLGLPRFDFEGGIRNLLPWAVNVDTGFDGISAPQLLAFGFYLRIVGNLHIHHRLAGALAIQSHAVRQPFLISARPGQNGRQVAFAPRGIKRTVDGPMEHNRVELAGGEFAVGEGVARAVPALRIAGDILFVIHPLFFPIVFQRLDFADLPGRAKADIAHSIGGIGE